MVLALGLTAKLWSGSRAAEVHSGGWQASHTSMLLASSMSRNEQPTSYGGRVSALLPDLAAWSSDDWGAAASVGTFVVAMAATVIGWRQLRQARSLREEEAAPFVVVDVVPS